MCWITWGYRCWRVRRGAVVVGGTHSLLHTWGLVPVDIVIAQGQTVYSSDCHKFDLHLLHM